MDKKNICPKCGCDYSYCYCVSNVDNATIPIDFITGGWPKPDWNLDPGYKAVTDEELERIKASFPKHKPLGWICPACGCGNAAWASKCGHCVPKTGTGSTDI